ncbi:Transmembrane protein 47 [Trichinella zimbabwensis]|uniref:Transmembrane protein 47 n=1 Tax=Trichinella zimbabwensis TaxID=268475 RepID=A0A0V1HDP3_9BILA|nr:Transmembrane protein 47 [Trichinella zimbabwensis]
MTAATTTIETVTIIRPLKIISLICECLALALLILALCTSSWLKTGCCFRTGLFRECVSDDVSTDTKLPLESPAPGQCQSSRIVYKAYFQTAAAFLILAALCIVSCIFATVLGLKATSLGRKYLYYKIAMYLALIAVISELISLIVFPVCFYLELENWVVTSWEFDWSYGIAWGTTICTFFACLMLICDKEHEEIYYKEKTVYASNQQVAV